jgi:hypothetical protein
MTRIFHELHSFICKMHTLIYKIRCVIPHRGSIQGRSCTLVPQVP